MLYVYKPIGQTCGELVKQLMQTQCTYKKVAFCGRLDPLAHGQMLCIFDDETKNTKQHLEHDKTYEFRFVIGLSTDTTDVMGLFNNEHYDDEINVNILLEYIKNIELNKQFQQKYHKFSSFAVKEIMTIKKMPLWYWSSKNISTKDYYKNVTIYNLDIISTQEVMLKDVVAEAIKNINSITNQEQFRIPTILKQYSLLLEDPLKKLVEIKIKATVSTGFYVRQFIQDLADHFHVKMIVVEIYRSEIIQLQ